MSDIRLERDGPVFVLRMRDGENRFDDAFLKDVHAALDEVERSSGPAALVTTGEGRFYSNGLDLAFLSGASRAEVERFLEAVHGLFARVLGFPLASVAALNGHAFAAGAMLSLAHDTRVMRADRGYFCLPEVDLRLPLQPGMTALIRARLPQRTAHEAIVTGRRYGGDDAVAAGIADLAVPEAGLLPRAIELAAARAAQHRETLAALKRGLYADVLEALGRPVRARAP